MKISNLPLIFQNLIREELEQVEQCKHNIDLVNALMSFAYVQDLAEYGLEWNVPLAATIENIVVELENYYGGELTDNEMNVIISELSFLFMKRLKGTPL